MTARGRKGCLLCSLPGLGSRPAAVSCYALRFVHLLYLDDAGSVGNPEERYFVLGGVCVFERQAYWLQRALDRVARAVGNDENLELHGSAIHARRGPWRRLSKPAARDLICRALAAAGELRGDWRLFCVIVDKKQRSPEDPAEYAFEQVCNRFDRFLARERNRSGGDKPSGLIVFDKSIRETRLQQLTADFRKTDSGHRWGNLQYFAEVPLFADSKATRLIQYADLVCYALWRKFERDDSEFFDLIAERFDRQGGVVHGLHHFRKPGEKCDCPACR